MKRLISLLVCAVLITPSIASADSSLFSNQSSIEQAFHQRQRHVQVTGEGTVTKLLRDDNSGSRHQKFILRLPSGQTLLIAHNIDLAPTIDNLQIGDNVAFYGEYEWNNKGGTVHWTHRDPGHRHIDGWLKHDGQVYQ